MTTTATRLAISLAAAAALASPAVSQTAQFKVVSPDLDDDYVGTDMDVEGSKILYAGRAHAYLLDIDLGEQRTFPGPLSDGQFGVRVAMDGNLVAVGNGSFDGGGGTLDASGAVDLFERDTGTFLRRLEPPLPEAGDFFGASIDVSGDRVLVGAQGDDDVANACGAAYVFEASTGTLLHKLTPSNGDFGYAFGQGVAMDGDRAVIGAQGADFMGGSEGAVYFFDVSTGTETFIFSNPESTYANDIGRFVDIDGATAIIGNIGGEVNGLPHAGKAWLVDVDTGNVLHTLESAQPMATEAMGERVAISGGLAVCGIPDADVAGKDRAGRVLVFDTATGNQIDALTAEDPLAHANFGEHVAMDGDVFLASVDLNATTNADGAVYVHDRSPGTWYFTGAGRVGSHGTPELTGTGTLAANDPFSVSLTGGVPNGTAFLVVGFGLFSLPAKKTILVPTPDVILYDLPLDGTGSLSLPSHWPPGVPAGTRILLQAWVPDGGAVANVSASNGLAGFAD
jgi:hypothetical protein